MIEKSINDRYRPLCLKSSDYARGRLAATNNFFGADIKMLFFKESISAAAIFAPSDGARNARLSKRPNVGCFSRVNFRVFNDMPLNT